MTEDFAIQSITLIAFIAFAAKRLLNYLHALQQDDYDNKRLMRWIMNEKVFDKKLSIVLILITPLIFVAEIPDPVVNFLIFLAFAFFAYFEKDPLKQAKKPLVLTNRAWRILNVGILYSAACGSAIAFTPLAPLWIIAVHALPLMLTLGNASLTPYERAVQRKLFAEAQLKLLETNPTVVAITGSYGKTSVKHILGHVLGRGVPTLVTPGSVNTIMGITRIIREQLQPHHKFFIVEMGAYGPGSIAALCNLTPPDYGIITAIGHAHYERFKTLDTVAHAKYELAEAVLEKKGTVVVHEKTLRFTHSRSIRNGAMDSFVVCGEPLAKGAKPKSPSDFSYLGADDLHIKSIVETPKGVCVKITWKGEKHTLRAPLFGIHHGHNMALAFACAVTLGMEAKDIKTALASTPQIKHRLEVKQHIDDTILIDDAYNSNPPGFRSALHALSVLAKDKGGRAILITPGIVELGAAHNETHKTLGKLSADICDIIIAVNPDRIPTFIEGIKSKKSGTILKQFNTFDDAQKWVIANKKSGDVILLENDLPDIYERVLKI